MLGYSPETPLDVVFTCLLARGHSLSRGTQAVVVVCTLGHCPERHFQAEMLMF